VAGRLILFLWHFGTLSRIPATFHSQGEQKFDSQQDDVLWRALVFGVAQAYGWQLPYCLNPTPIAHEHAIGGPQVQTSLLGG
jgi:alpha-D-ribose 1-methylphosphonate 5-phosphate C-P lyase